MFKFTVFLVLLLVAVNAQYEEEPIDYGDDYEICIGSPDETLFGVGQDESCSEYFYCQDEVGLKQDCGEGYHFDYERNECGFEEDIPCGDGGGGNEPDPDPIPDTPEPTRATRAPTDAPTTIPPSDPSIPDIECPTNRPGEIIFFPSSNCSEYFICANGFRMKMACMEGFTWNQAEKQCDYPIFSQCSQNIRDDGMNVNCMRTGFYSTAYPRDCTKFVFCSAGIPMVQNCPVGYAWNNDRCVLRQFASCPDLRRLL